jgi:hypothetical protein
MRNGIFLVLLLCANAALADVFTCQTPSGETVYSDVPCAKGATIERITPSESEHDPVAAQREVERQKAYVERQAAENAKTRGRTSGIGILPDYSGPPPKWPAPTPVSPSTSMQSPTPPNAR